MASRATPSTSTTFGTFGHAKLNHDPNNWHSFVQHLHLHLEKKEPVASFLRTGVLDIFDTIYHPMAGNAEVRQLEMARVQRAQLKKDHFDDVNHKVGCEILELVHERTKRHVADTNAAFRDELTKRYYNALTLFKSLEAVLGQNATLANDMYKDDMDKIFTNIQQNKLSLEDHNAAFRELVQDMSNAGIIIPERRKVVRYLKSLSPRFHNEVKAMFRLSQDPDDPTKDIQADLPPTLDRAIERIKKDVAVDLNVQSTKQRTELHMGPDDETGIINAAVMAPQRHINRTPAHRNTNTRHAQHATRNNNNYNNEIVRHTSKRPTMGSTHNGTSRKQPRSHEGTLNPDPCAICLAIRKRRYHNHTSSECGLLRWNNTNDSGSSHNGERKKNHINAAKRITHSPRGVNSMTIGQPLIDVRDAANISGANDGSVVHNSEDTMYFCHATVTTTTPFRFDPDDVFVLDNCCTNHTVRASNINLLRNVRCGSPRLITGYGGIQTEDKVGELDYFDTAILSDHSPLNLISEGTLIAQPHTWRVDRSQDKLHIYITHLVSMMCWHFTFNPHLRIFVSPIHPRPATKGTALPTVVEGQRRFTLAEVQRAQLAREFHRALGHPNDEDHIRAFACGEHLGLGYGPPDIINAHTLLGYCPGCRRGKAVRPSISHSEPKPKEPIGALQHIDIVFIAAQGGKRAPIPVCLDDGSGYKIGAQLSRRTALDLVAFQEAVLGFYETRGWKPRAFRSDSEATFIKSGLVLLRRQPPIEALFATPGRHERVIERAIGTLERKTKAITADILNDGYFQLPARFHPRAFLWAMQSDNLVCNSRSGSVTPHVLVHTTPVDAARHLRFSFGDVVIAVNEPGIPTLRAADMTAYNTDIGIVTGRKLAGDGTTEVYNLSTQRYTNRNTAGIYKIPPTPWAIEQLNTMYENDKLPPGKADQLVMLERGGSDYVPLIDEYTPTLIDDTLQTQSKQKPVHHNHKPLGGEQSTQSTPHIDNKRFNLRSNRNTSIANATILAMHTMPHDTHKSGCELGFIACATVIAGLATMTLNQALKLPRAAQAEAAAEAEVRQLYEETKSFIPRRLRDLQPGSKVIPSSMIIADKHAATGDYERTKGRLAAGGNLQLTDVFGKHSSPTVATTAVFILLAILAYHGNAWNYKTVDIKGAFLHADYVGNAGTLYMRLQRATATLFVKLYPEYESYVCADGTLIVEIRKAIYGLKESGLLWYKHITTTLKNLGYTPCAHDACVFVKVVGGERLMIALHVDDLLCIYSDHKMMTALEEALQARYGTITINGGSQQTYLGMLIACNPDGSVRCTMPGYVDKLLDKHIDSIRGCIAHTPSDSKLFEEATTSTTIPPTPYQSLVMALMYLALRTRPDILKECAYLATHLQKPTSSTWGKAMRVLKYLNFTRDRGITFSPGELQLHVWIDASYAIHADAKSHSGVMITMGDRSGPVYVSSRKQKYMTTSSTWSELSAIHDGLPTVLWCRELLNELGYKQGPIVIRQDNQSTIQLAHSGKGASAQTKHLKVRYFYIKEHLDNNTLRIMYEPTEHMTADVLTKPLAKREFDYHTDALLNEHNIGLPKRPRL